MLVAGQLELRENIFAIGDEMWYLNYRNIGDWDYDKQAWLTKLNMDKYEYDHFNDANLPEYRYLVIRCAKWDSETKSYYKLMWDYD